MASDGGSDPRTESFRDDRPEIQALFELALEARLPRKRELKPWEPQRLNERHLAMVMMRASGVQQRTVARAFDATDANVSIVLNHPDAEYLLSRLAAMKATHTTDIEARLRALATPAIETLEAVFDSAAPPEDTRAALRRAPLAFKVLDINGHGRRAPQEHLHRHQLEASPKELSNLARALREMREIPEAQVVETMPALGPAGELPASPPSELSTQVDAGAPSTSDLQVPSGEDFV